MRDISSPKSFSLNFVKINFPVKKNIFLSIISHSCGSARLQTIIFLSHRKHHWYKFCFVYLNIHRNDPWYGCNTGQVYMGNSWEFSRFIRINNIRSVFESTDRQRSECISWLCTEHFQAIIIQKIFPNTEIHDIN